MRLDRDRTLLLVIDVQERLFPAMDLEQGSRLLANLERWGAAAKILGLAVTLSEQYPQGLGPTVPRVKAAFSAEAPIAKLSFDALGDPAIEAKVEGRSAVLVAGMETHICVYQTVRSLAERGVRVQVLSDAVASRTRENYGVGLELCRAAGALISSTEAALFDLVGRAGTDEFRAIAKLVR